MNLSSCCKAPAMDWYGAGDRCSNCENDCVLLPVDRLFPDLQPPAEDKNGHKIGVDGKIVHDERCSGCDAPEPPAESIEFVEVTPDIQKQMDDVMQLLQTSEPEPNCHKCGKPVECQAAIPPENRTLDGHICEYSSKPLQTSEIEKLLKELNIECLELIALQTSGQREAVHTRMQGIMSLKELRDILVHIRSLEENLSVAVEALISQTTCGNCKDCTKTSRTALSKILPPTE